MKWLKTADYFGALCIQVRILGASMDLDVRRHGVGFSLGLKGARRSMCLDVHAPLGEPDRLCLTGRRLCARIGLRPGHGSQLWSWRESKFTMRWGPVSVYPADWVARWRKAHPAEAAAQDERVAARQAGSS